MEKINQIVEIANQSHHLPLFISILIGALTVKKRVYIKREDTDILGDNAPFTLIDSLWSYRYRRRMKILSYPVGTGG